MQIRNTVAEQITSANPGRQVLVGRPGASLRQLLEQAGARIA